MFVDNTPETEREIASRVTLSMSEKMVLADEVAKMKRLLHRIGDAVEDGDALTLGDMWTELGMPLTYVQGILQHKYREAAATYYREKGEGSA